MSFDDEENDGDGGASLEVTAAEGQIHFATGSGGGGFDDEDSPAHPAAAAAARHGTTAAGGDNYDMGSDEEGDDKQADFLKFAASLPGASSGSSKKGSGGGKLQQTKKQAGTTGKKALRRGEKDFESHGTRAQVSVLEDSRNAMGQVLGFTRTHKSPGHKDYLRGWFFPEWWAAAKDEVDEDGDAGIDVERQDERRPVKDTGMFPRQRVVVLESDGGSTLFRNTGRVFRGLEKDKPARSRMWLLPEEALYLVERGDLDLWWPYRSLPEMFPPESGTGEQAEVLGAGKADYNLGMPLSLQAAYSLLLGKDGERGKVSLEKYQVYTNLRRTGYTVLRATSIPLPPKPPVVAHSSVWQWLLSMLPSSSESHYAADGPLVKPGLYRSYRQVFEQQAIVQRHKPTYETDPSASPADPFRVHYHVWKSSSTFTKARPPPPNFQIAVVDTRTSSVPTLEELTTLLESTPWDPPAPAQAPKNGGGPNVGFMYKRLKHGWRNTIIAVVDRGLVSYIRLTELAFGEELLYEGFDNKNKGGGSKRGGRGGGGGRGGHGGRGGRGGKRGG